MQGLKRQDVACNLCGENDAKHLFTVRSFNVVKRLICGLVYLNPMPRQRISPGHMTGANTTVIKRRRRVNLSDGMTLHSRRIQMAELRYSSGTNFSISRETGL